MSDPTATRTITCPHCGTDWSELAVVREARRSYPGTRLVVVSEDIDTLFVGRNEHGDRLTFEWGEPDERGWYTPTITQHTDDNIVEQHEQALRERGWRDEDEAATDAAMNFGDGRAAALAEPRRLVDEQAEDEGLWFVAETAAEAYLQQELRRLHAAVEGDALAETPEAEPCDDPRCGLSLGHAGGHWRWYGDLAETPEDRTGNGTAGPETPEPPIVFTPEEVAAFPRGAGDWGALSPADRWRVTR